MQRSNTRPRSQTFHWVSATLLYYLCDRAALHSIITTSKARIVFCYYRKGSKMVVLKMRRYSSTSSLASTPLYVSVSSIRLGILLHRVRTRLAFYRILHRSIQRAVLDWKVVAVINDNRRRTNRSALRIDVDLMAIRHGPGQEGRFQSRPRRWNWYRYVTRSDVEQISCILLASTHSPFLYTLLTGIAHALA
jgi:hypothetical protein